MLVYWKLGGSNWAHMQKTILCNQWSEFDLNLGHANLNEMPISLKPTSYLKGL